MCLLLLAFDVVPGRPWLLLGNRDEFHGRASLPAARWTDAPDVAGGRDVEAGGSWLALHRSGRFASVTNVRSGAPHRAPRSRGELVAAFVRGAATPSNYAAEVAARSGEYGPFNLIVGDRQSAAAASSTSPRSWALDRGVHVFSNGAPGSEWPKEQRITARFTALLEGAEAQRSPSSAPGARVGDIEPRDDVLLELLTDTEAAADEHLPDTGVGIELERLLAPVFIRGSRYGTRASTLAYARDDDSCVLIERSFGPDGVFLGEARIET